MSDAIPARGRARPAVTTGTRTRLTARGRIVVGALAGLLALVLLQAALGGGGADPGPWRLAVEAGPKLVVVDTFAAEATFYGPGLPADAVTASGAPFDPQGATAAHPTLPFGTRARVTLAPDGPSLVVVVNDRLPDAPPTRIDLTLGAAQVLGMVDAGRAAVQVEVLAEGGR